VAGGVTVAGLGTGAPASPVAGGSGGGHAVREAAYVVSRTMDALARLDRRGAVLYQRWVTSAGGRAQDTELSWSYVGPRRADIGRWHSVSLSAAGHPVLAQWITGSRRAVGSRDELAGRQRVVVVYRSRTWFATPASDDGPPAGKQHGCAARDLAGTGLPGNLSALVSCGALVAAGRQEVDGIDAIRLVLRHQGQVLQGSINRDGVFYPAIVQGITIWVDPVTYLPVRIAVDGNWSICSPGGCQLIDDQGDFRWLPPTAASLATLTGRIPPGFRQVPVPRH
jgi:hypothetical protein